MKRKTTAGPTRVAVFGAGSWGTTFAKVLADAGADVTIRARRAEVATEINDAHRNSEYLPGVNLPRRVHATTRLDLALDGAEQIYLSVPSQSLRRNLALVNGHLSDTSIVISLIKGVERTTGKRMSEVIAEELSIDPARIAVASGPNLALEIAREQPTASVVASQSLETAQAVARTASNRYLKFFVNTDVIGTEFAGVLKNLIALAIGIVDGVGYGENTKAAIITRGLVEMTDFAVAYGALPETLTGLAGLGDVIATCASPLSRNNTAGRLLGQGYSFSDVIAQMDQTAEGLASVKAVLTLARQRDVRMPIVRQVGQVLDGTLDPKDMAPHMTTESDEPQGERNPDGQSHGRSRVRGALQRAFDQLRHSGRNPRRDRS